MTLVSRMHITLDSAIKHKIEQLEKCELTLDRQYPIKFGFLLSTYYPTGYSISFNNHLIEYELSCSINIPKHSILYYFGPLKLFYYENDAFHKIQPTNHGSSDNNQWIGINAERFKPYQSWINKNGTCGMMSATVMLAYYQDYIDEAILPPTYRTKNGDETKLYSALLKTTKSLSFKGTIAFDVSYGINRLLRRVQRKDSPITTRAKGMIAPTFGIVKTRCKSSIPTPTIVGLVTILNSPKNYQNHWVVAYAYQEKDNEKYYKVHDNHGQYQAVVNVKWTLSTVKLNRKLNT